MNGRCLEAQKMMVLFSNGRYQRESYSQQEPYFCALDICKKITGDYVKTQIWGKGLKL